MSSAARSAICVTARVPAKVNLELNVGPLREDGFHHLATVFQAVGIYDDVSVEPADDWGITVNGPYADLVPADDTNLAMRAARLLASEAGIDVPVHITIDKDIPVAGGMAGGSADAAGALVACDALWGVAVLEGSAGGPGRRARQRRAVRPHRRYGDGVRSRGPAGAGARTGPLSLGVRPQRRRPVDAQGLCRVRPPAGQAAGSRARTVRADDDRSARR